MYSLDHALDIAFDMVRVDTDPATFADCDETTQLAVFELVIESPEIHAAAAVDLAA